MKRAHVALLVLMAASMTGAIAVVGCSSSSSSGGTGNPKPDGGGEPDSHKSDGAMMMMGMDSGSCVAPVDAAAYADSQCGHPGDKGNSLGVGSFCVTSNDCACNSTALLCSTLGGPGDYFCTALCTPPPDGGPDGGDSGCGENASCQCNGSPPCGCTPNSCL